MPENNGRVRAVAAAIDESTQHGRSRTRSRIRGGDDEDVPDFEALMAGLRADVFKHVDDNLKSTADNITSTFTGVVRALDVKVEKRFSVVEASLTDLGAAQSSLQSQYDVLKGEIKEMLKQLHVCESGTTLEDPPVTSGRPFDGPVDTTILRVETQSRDIIAKTTLDEFIKNLFLEANVERDKYNLIGDDTDFRFVIKFTGTAGLAARRVDQARHALRDASGKFKELSISKPAGGSTRIFINPDRNPKMQKLERETKRMGNIFKDLYKDIKWHINRIDGEISKDWKPILKLEVHPKDTPTRILWNLAALSEVDINKQDAVDKFTDFAKERSKVNWSL